MSSKSFLFKKKVGMYSLPVNEMAAIDCPVPYVESPNARIEMVQNGYQLRYHDEEFVTENLEKALEMLKSWFEKQEEEAEERDKESSEHNSSHES